MSGFGVLANSHAHLYWNCGVLDSLVWLSGLGTEVLHLVEHFNYATGCGRFYCRFLCVKL